MNRRWFVKQYGLKCVIGLEVQAWKSFFSLVFGGHSIHAAFFAAGMEMQDSIQALYNGNLINELTYPNFEQSCTRDGGEPACDKLHSDDDPFIECDDCEFCKTSEELYVAEFGA